MSVPGLLEKACYTGSTAGWQKIYRIILVGVLGSYLLVASGTGLHKEVNTFTS